MPDQFGGIEVEEETEVSVGMRDEFGGIPVEEVSQEVMTEQVVGDVGPAATPLMRGDEVFPPEPSGVTGGTLEEQMFAAQI